MPDDEEVNLDWSKDGMKIKETESTPLEQIKQVLLLPL